VDDTAPTDAAEPEAESPAEAESEAGAEPTSEPGEPTSEPGEPAVAARRGRPVIAIVGGALALVYVVWYVVDLLVLDLSPSTFNATHRLDGSVGMRLVFAVVFGGILLHGLDGLRVIAGDLWPPLRGHDAGLRFVVNFLAVAIWIPSTVVLLWPAIQFWFAG
jgi:hypothetical protein